MNMLIFLSSEPGITEIASGGRRWRRLCGYGPGARFGLSDHRRSNAWQQPGTLSEKLSMSEASDRHLGSSELITYSVRAISVSFTPPWPTSRVVSRGDLDRITACMVGRGIASRSHRSLRSNLRPDLRVRACRPHLCNIHKARDRRETLKWARMTLRTARWKRCQNGPLRVSFSSLAPCSETTTPGVRNL